MNTKINNRLVLVFAVTSLAFSCKSADQNTTNNQNRPPRNQQGGGQQNTNRQGPPSTDEIFTKMDANKDGLLSAQEVNGPLKNNFTKIDTNNDGFISKEELNNRPKPQRQGNPNGNR